jgi:hypothetical protein
MGKGCWKQKTFLLTQRKAGPAGEALGSRPLWACVSAHLTRSFSRALWQKFLSPGVLGVSFLGCYIRNECPIPVTTAIPKGLHYWGPKPQVLHMSPCYSPPFSCVPSVLSLSTLTQHTMSALCLWEVPPTLPATLGQGHNWHCEPLSDLVEGVPVWRGHCTRTRQSARSVHKEPCVGLLAAWVTCVSSMGPGTGLCMELAVNSYFFFGGGGYWDFNSGPTPWATPPGLCYEGFFKKESHKLFAWVGFEPWASWSLPQVARITDMSHWSSALSIDGVDITVVLCSPLWSHRNHFHQWTQVAAAASSRPRMGVHMAGLAHHAGTWTQWGVLHFLWASLVLPPSPSQPHPLGSMLLKARTIHYVSWDWSRAYQVPNHNWVLQAWQLKRKTWNLILGTSRVWASNFQWEACNGRTNAGELLTASYQSMDVLEVQWLWFSS